MATREIRDAQSITTGEKIYFRGHAGATYMSDGSTVEDSINSLKTGGNDTKNTAGATDTNDKIYLVGAKDQSDNPQTYSHDTVYVDTNGDLNSTNKVKTGRVDYASSTITDASTEPNLFKAAIEPTSTTNVNTQKIFRFGLDGQGTVDYSNCKINKQYAATNMWVAGDTYGYISTPYLDSDKANVYIGGGNSAGHSWSAKLLHSDNLNSHLSTELNSLLPQTGYTDIKYNTNSLSLTNAGWYRVASFSNSTTSSSTYGSYLVSITGAWNYSNATTATFIVNKSNSSVSITQLGKGRVGATITKLRLVQDATKGNTIYLDAYKNNTTREELDYRITPLSFRFNQYGLDATTNDFGCQILTGDIAPEGGTLKQEITIFKDYDIETANTANTFANLTPKTITKSDNNGYPTILLISEYTDKVDLTSNIGTYGFSGQFVSTRNVGYSSEESGFVSARLSYSDNDRGWDNFYTTWHWVMPVAVKYNNKYYIGLKITGSGRNIELIGRFYNCLSSYIELKYSSQEVLPEGVEILREGNFNNRFIANKVSNALTITSGSTTIEYDGSAAKNITISSGGTSTATTYANSTNSQWYYPTFITGTSTNTEYINSGFKIYVGNATSTSNGDIIVNIGSEATSSVKAQKGFLRLYGESGSTTLYGPKGTNSTPHTVYLPSEPGTLVVKNDSGSINCNVTGDVTGNVSGSSGSCTGNAATATTATNATNAYINTSTTSSYYPMTFVTSTGAGNKGLYIDGSTGTTSTSTGIRYNPSTNTCYCSGGFYEASDERLKNFGDDIEVDLDKLSKLSKKYFTWKDDESNAQHIGVSAQEVQAIYPELVEAIDDEGHLSVSYDKLSIVALAGIDKLNDKVKLLEDRLERLEKLLNV